MYVLLPVIFGKQWQSILPRTITEFSKSEQVHKFINNNNFTEDQITNMFRTAGAELLMNGILDSDSYNTEMKQNYNTVINEIGANNFAEAASRLVAFYIEFMTSPPGHKIKNEITMWIMAIVMMGISIGYTVGKGENGLMDVSENSREKVTDVISSFIGNSDDIEIADLINNIGWNISDIIKGDTTS